jgi:hypothetical protein
MTGFQLPFFATTLRVIVLSDRSVIIFALVLRGTLTPSVKFCGFVATFLVSSDRVDRKALQS